MPVFVKICLCGDGEVGKTSLRNRYLGRGFKTEYIATLGSDFVSKEVKIKVNSKSRKIRFQIWDLAGQPSFKQIRTLYFRQAVGAFLIFDITRPDTLQNLKGWIKELSTNSGTSDIVVIVLGNKIDLQDENTIDAKTAENYIKKELIEFENIDKNIIYLETSAKNGINIDVMFHEMGRNLLKKIK
ncbi:MAG: GTP-binding protein [Candidatus Heimdallarchaeota archaeon]|nr:MAG: GTP-binding protein [Candidatus Heimdallarchaeota archaeon]